MNDPIGQMYQIGLVRGKPRGARVVVNFAAQSILPEIKAVRQ